MKKIFFILAVMTLHMVSVAQAVTTFDKLPLPISARVEAAAITDLNGDGREDVVAATSNYYDPTYDYKIIIFLQNAEGKLGEPMIYNGGMGGSLAIGDINNDDRPDIITIPKYPGAGIGVRYQKEDGTFKAMRNFGQVKFQNVKVGDINNDGLLDVVGIDWESDSLQVFYQQPVGVLADPVSYHAEHRGSPDLALGDVNNDGLTDVVVMNGMVQSNSPEPLPNIIILLQQLDGSLAEGYSFTVGGWTNANAIELGDFNNDRLNDIAIAYGGNKPTSKMGILLQDPAGGFKELISYPSYDIPRSIAVADINKDGRADIVVGHAAFNAVGVYLQKAGGALAAENLFSTPFDGFYPDDLAVGDIDGDGLPDIVAGSGTLLQRSLDCTYSISPSSATFGLFSESSDFFLTTNDPACPWEAVSNKSWLRPSLPVGKGNAAIHYVVDGNFSASQRAGAIRIAGQVFQVTQSGCDYTLDQPLQRFGSTGGQEAAGVTTNGYLCRWDATSNDAWITVTSGSGHKGNGTLPFTKGVEKYFAGSRCFVPTNSV